MTKDKPAFRAIVVGGGPVGLTAAVALAQGGIATVLVGKKPAPGDNRTTALLASSVTALETLGVWPLCHEQSAPLRFLRIVDDTGRLWRAPEVKFEADEIGLAAFGWNIENRVLVKALIDRARALPKLEIVEDEVLGVAVRPEYAAVELKQGGMIQAPLIVGADGRKSLCREAALIDTDEHRYRQVALTVCFRHTRPHHETSTEFHTPSGQCTVVPLPGNRASLVWVLDPAVAKETAALDDAALSASIERAIHSILGKITVERGRGLFPLGLVTARSFGRNRIALVGEAAHVIPPVGAQGLNLGLRDAATIAELAAAAQRDHQDIGGELVLARYEKMRRADVSSRTLAVDLLNRSLLTDLLPVQSARGLGLYALERIGPLRRAVMREGVAPRAAQPRLMRGQSV
ncbi:MAG TPA: UbiH/UbiF family hydroxylase [Pseudolabrys sp.]|nr:UbiH/UbiF family hydroxylase [Pseudolabrys sp.]